MDEKSILSLLHNLQVSLQGKSYAGSKKRTRWLNVSCPFAPFTHSKGSDNNPSFGITINDAGRSHYKCLSCGVKGRLSALPTKLGGYRKRDYTKLRHWAEMSELQAAVSRPVVDWEQASITQEEENARDEKLPAYNAIEGYPRAMGIPYLRERGIVWPTPLKLNLRYDSFQRRILFPCFDSKDRFRGFTGRSVLPAKRLSKENPKVRDYYGLDKRKLFLGLRGGGKGPKILVEGLFDYARLVQAGYTNTRAILGTALTPEKLDILIDEGDPVYFFMDNDLAGWNALFGTMDEDGKLDKDNSWAFNLYTEIPVWIVPYPNTFDGLDPGSILDRNVKKHIDRAWLFTGKVPLTSTNERHLMLP